MMMTNKTKCLQVGDLVVFNSSVLPELRNKIGIILNSVFTVYQEENFPENKWYIASFGDFVLIISTDMVEKINV